ncbi:hypothetical protein X474_16260 [Dethiosulfatarculus sandiegensis]|uniref:Uncharacterized protein n=1 Tax=Dethiosulfatarculus sandiegensis TaxID=1429043 RepID=A0A0D2J4H6_9BACT|nr:hypothetical protein X474_16260 [Dethiosulfatarculus sandiegensis]
MSQTNYLAQSAGKQFYPSYNQALLFSQIRLLWVILRLMTGILKAGANFPFLAKDLSRTPPHDPRPKILFIQKLNVG